MAAAVRVLLFSTAREAVGLRSLDLPIAEEGTAIQNVIAALTRKYPRLGPVIRASRVVVNGHFVEPDRALLRPGDELAIHPPYSGG
ncbi:MAG: MoaD/ThiS family protein [Thermoplasmata archaeon]|nr:MoaD/ThiS family protein [Thermoplasmata archaeon]